MCLCELTRLIIHYAIILYPTLSLLIVLGPVPFAGELPSDFDPVIIASRLRQIGDQCNMDFERVSSQALAEPGTHEGQILCFGAAVDSLSRSWSDQNPEMVYERAFLSVSVKLMMHILKKVPSMFHPSQLIKVINGNAQVKNYIEAHGGWVSTRSSL
uniref:BCL2 like 15 n=1 Tax=Anas platyrhynchos platyrhynchos TaxID=8840 RepID=U3IW84_ANAPP